MDTTAHKEYELTVESRVSDAASPYEHGVPNANTALARLCQRFACARFAYRRAELLYKEAREALMLMLPLPPVSGGPYSVCDTVHVHCVAHVSNGARRLDESKLRHVLMERLDLDTSAIDAVVEQCKITADPITKFTVTLRR